MEDRLTARITAAPADDLQPVIHAMTVAISIMISLAAATTVRCLHVVVYGESLAPAGSCSRRRRLAGCVEAQPCSSHVPGRWSPQSRGLQARWDALCALRAVGRDALCALIIPPHRSCLITAPASTPPHPAGFWPSLPRISLASLLQHTVFFGSRQTNLTNAAQIIEEREAARRATGGSADGGDSVAGKKQN